MKSRTHMARVAALECCICGRSPVQVHHLRTPEFSGGGQKASDLFTIPLCKPCHDNFHATGRKKWEMQFGRQIKYLAETLNRIMYEK